MGQERKKVFVVLGHVVSSNRKTKNLWISLSPVAVLHSITECNQLHPIYSSRSADLLHPDNSYFASQISFASFTKNQNFRHQNHLYSLNAPSHLQSTTVKQKEKTPSFPPQESSSEEQQIYKISVSVSNDLSFPSLLLPFLPFLFLWVIPSPHTAVCLIPKLRYILTPLKAQGHREHWAARPA